ncbi:MAG TPA: glycoside hydrolase family 44 protein [Bryobacteraceae bacterium]|jgi:xylan 1,4-beta-xylosidase|nr:glycoside hydrolase family 44 protein [Bryobacteraceae bacterium]
MTKLRLLVFLLSLQLGWTQNAVTIQVNIANRVGAYKPIYAYFGYDEPNYTYTKNGRKLVGELGALSRTPVYIRTHFMLATGNGTPGLKWGSTNAYTEDASGKPIYDWTITDRIFDTYLHAGAKPFVEIGFMPKALSANPNPYQPTWIPGAKNDHYNIGWTYPPKDYAKWAELVHQWVSHAVSKYGQSEVASWYWEVWNEPDIGYWHGTPEEYDKLYDYTADAVKRALPTAKVGGPASTGPSGQRAGNFLHQFLEHCAADKNFVTGATGAPLDFISYHAKGRPTVVDGHVLMGISKEAEDVEAGFRLVNEFPKFRELPIILSEADPEGCAACSARVYPQNAYRNGTLYPAYTAVMMKNIFELADRSHTNIAGMLTWAFQFDDQPYFDGFRTLATNGIDKPVLNIFRMAGLMQGDRVAVESTSAVNLETMLKSGVRNGEDVDALAVRSDRTVSVLAWNYADADVTGPDANVDLNISGLPGAVRRVLVRHYRIDRTHSNAYTVWKKMGSPQQPAPEQYAELEAAGQLHLLDSPTWRDVRDGSAKLDFALPRQGVSLVQLSW